jgi:tRNA A-37 threonylcarbamoyl transferase component Bud32
VARSNTTTTRRVELGADGLHARFFLKVYHHEGPGRRRRLLRDKCAREARNYRLLHERCAVGVPEVVAHGARRRGLHVLESFIMTRAIDGAMSLEQLNVPRLATSPGPCGAAMRRKLLAITAALVARMHAAGFYHIDLQWRNLLVASSANEEPRIFVLDCVRGGLRRTALGRAHGRVRDLSSLHKDARHRLSRTEQLRWLRTYLGIRRMGPEEKALIQAIVHDRRIKDAGSRR